MSEHTWYPENPLEGDPESADVLALLASLKRDRPISDAWSGNADTDKYWGKES